MKNGLLLSIVISVAGTVILNLLLNGMFTGAMHPLLRIALVGLVIFLAFRFLRNRR